MKPRPEPRTIVVWQDHERQRYICACGTEDKPFSIKPAVASHNDVRHGGTYKVVYS